MKSKLLLIFALAGGSFASGCASDYPVERVESPVNVTHEVAFGEYRRVFNTTYHILNRYGVIQTSTYRYGEIKALIGEDTSLFQKTRREIEARIIDAGDYWDVQCRVLIKVEDSEPATFDDQFNPLYEWKTVASDPRLEVRLNNEIRGALSGGAWKAKQPLRPEPIAPYTPSRGKARPAKKGKVGAAPKSPAKRSAKPATKPATDESEEVRHRGTAPDLDVTTSALERLGVLRLRRGAYADAAKALRATIQGESDHPRAHFLLAQTLVAQGSYREAQAALINGLRANPAWVESDLDLRDLHDEAATFNALVEKVEHALSRDASLSLLLGYLRFHTGDAESALVAFDAHLRTERSPVVERYRNAARQRVDAAHGLENF